MPASPSDKVIVTHKESLKNKYKAAGVATIDAELKNLIAADAKRGLNTVVIDLSSSGDAKKYGFTAIPLASVGDARKHKQAIDKVYAKTGKPAYLMLLGAVDVIPHVPLKNPVYSSGADDDQTADSDLPYACSAGYSTDPRKYIAPDRVVGRLPDLTGGTDPKYLVGLLKVATRYKSRSRSDYDPYVGLTAKVWQNSTELSLDAVFGGHADLQISPPVDYPATPVTHLDRLAQFINCHGNTATPEFYGQDAFGYPVALDAAKIPNSIKEGTVVAAECCYGAELYNPALSTHMGICSTYLDEKAYAFFGSSTIAYGPSSGNGQADLICQHFLQHVRAGASLGRACLLARLDFVKGLGGVVTGTDLKTLAQFNLLGDPALTPVAAVVSSLSGAEMKLFKPAKKGLAGTAAAATAQFLIDRFTRDGRREWLRQYSAAITTVVAVVADAVVDSISHGKKSGATSPAMAKALRDVATEMGMSQPTVMTFALEGGQQPRGTVAKALAAKAIAKGAPAMARQVHLAIERQQNGKAILIRGFEAIELDGTLNVRKFVSR